MWIAHSKVYVQSSIQSGVYHDLYIRRVESVIARVQYPIRSDVTSGVQHTYMYQIEQSVTVHYYLLCQRTSIATYNRRIPYYIYYTC